MGSAVIMNVGGMNEEYFIAEQMAANNKSSPYWNHCLIAFVFAVSIVFMVICGHTARTFVQSETMGSFTSSVQSYHKSLYPNTQIDPNYLRNELHQRTADKVSNTRINEGIMPQLSLYDKMKNVGVDEHILDQLMDKNKVKAAENRNDLIMSRNAYRKKEKSMKRKYESGLPKIQNQTVKIPKHTPKILEDKRKMGKLLQMKDVIQINQVMKRGNAGKIKKIV